MRKVNSCCFHFSIITISHFSHQMLYDFTQKQSNLIEISLVCTASGVTSMQTHQHVLCYLCLNFSIYQCYSRKNTMQSSESHLCPQLLSLNFLTSLQEILYTHLSWNVFVFHPPKELFLSSLPFTFFSSTLTLF